MVGTSVVEVCGSNWGLAVEVVGTVYGVVEVQKGAEVEGRDVVWRQRGGGAEVEGRDVVCGGRPHAPPCGPRDRYEVIALVNSPVGVGRITRGNTYFRRAKNIYIVKNIDYRLFCYIILHRRNYLKLK